MPGGTQRFTPAAAILVAVLGACAVMVNPITLWPLGVAVCGGVVGLLGTVALIVGQLRR
jgi:hypothetical protein